MYANNHIQKTLADLLDGGRKLTREEIISVILPAADILADMHSRGSIHGHISPKAILLHDNSQLFFCCPLSLKTQTGLLANIKAAGSSLGYTVSLANWSGSYTSNDMPYRALETYMRAPLTPSADIYSLCAVMYHALTGIPPKNAQERMYDNSDIFSDLFDTAGTSAAEIIAKGMSLMPTERYTDIKALADALTALNVSNMETEQKDTEKEAFKDDSKIFPDRPAIKYTRAKERFVLPADFLDILTARYKKSGQNFHRNRITSIVFHQSFDLMIELKPPIFFVQKTSDSLDDPVAWLEEDFLCTGIRDGICLHISANGVIHTSISCRGMFADCQNLERINFNSSLDTSAAVDMRRMFYGCRHLSSLNLSGFDTSKVETMESMFEGCGSFSLPDLKKIVESLDFSGITGDGLKNMYKGTVFESELTALNLFPASNPPVEKRFSPMEHIRLLCEDFAAKYPKRYRTGISDVLKAGLGLKNETVYLSHDDTWLKSGKNGFAITDHGFVCRNLMQDPQRLTFKAFKAAKKLSPITSKISDANILADGQPIVYVTAASDNEKKDLNNLIQSIQKTL